MTVDESEKKKIIQEHAIPMAVNQSPIYTLNKDVMAYNTVDIKNYQY